MSYTQTEINVLDLKTLEYKDKKRVKEVIAFVKENGGIDYTIAKMNDYKNKALSILETYPDSPYKNSLLQMIDYVVERKI